MADTPWIVVRCNPSAVVTRPTHQRWYDCVPRGPVSPTTAKRIAGEVADVLASDVAAEAHALVDEASGRTFGIQARIAVDYGDDADRVHDVRLEFDVCYPWAGVRIWRTASSTDNATVTSAYGTGDGYRFENWSTAQTAESVLRQYKAGILPWRFVRV
jgi:hypothetical protein